MSEKLSKSFPPTINPVHVGPYKCVWDDNMIGGVWFNWWDGKHWHYGQKTAREASPNARVITDDLKKMRCWQGVLK